MNAHEIIVHKVDCDGMSDHHAEDLSAAFGGEPVHDLAALGQKTSLHPSLDLIITDLPHDCKWITDMIFACPKLSEAELTVIRGVEERRDQLSHVLRQPRRWVGVLRRSTFARAIQGSNSIEGYNVTFEDAIAAIDGEEPLEASAEAWEAIRGYRDAMTYIMQLTEEPTFGFTEGFIKSIHFMMLKYDLTKRPGRYRPGHIYVRNDATGQVVYEGPDIDLIPSLMKEFMECLNAPDDKHALIRAAMSHLNLVMIHPFSDGNGRMGRALQTLVLSRDGIGEPTFSSIEEYLGRNTQDYYNVLADVGAGNWHPDRDATPWIRFCLTAHFRQAETLLRRTKESGRIWGELEYMVETRGLHERMIYALFDATLGWRVRNATYRRGAEISENLASRDLKELTDAGFLIPQGEKRGRFYVPSQPLKDLRARCREKRPILNPFAQVREPLLPGFTISA